MLNCHRFVIASFFVLLLFVIAVYSSTAYAAPGVGIGDEQVVVTGTRTIRSVEDSPVPIEVVTQRELELVSDGTLAQALDFISGVVVKRSVKDGYNIYMQGFGSSQVAVLINGMPLVSPTDESVDLDQISALNVERIEVIRGASSVLYGSSAMGGVVNIITSEPTSNSLHASYELGQFIEQQDDSYDSASKANIAGSIALNDWYGQLTHQDIYNPGFDYAPENIARDAGEVDKKNTRLNLGKTSGDWKIHVANQWFEEEKYKITGRFAGGGENYYRSDVDQEQSDLHVLYKKHWKFQVRDVSHDEQSGQRGSLRTTNISNTDVDTHFVWNVFDMEWVSGLHYYEESMNQLKQDGTIEVDNVSRDGSEFFVQTDWFVRENFELLGGVRFQRDSTYGSHSALKLNSKWLIPLSDKSSLNWRTTLGEGYRVPSLKERYYQFDHSNLGYIVIGNPNLQPETSFSINSSIEFTQAMSEGSDIVLELAAHHSDAENLIESQFNALQSQPDLEVYEYQNLGDVRVRGADASVKFVQAKQRAQLSYQYLDARNRDDNHRLANRPYHQIKANYQRDFDWLESQVLLYLLFEKNESYSQPESVANSTTDINITYAMKLNKYLSIRVGIENLFDEHRKANLNEAEYFDLRPVSSRYAFTQIKFSL